MIWAAFGLLGFDTHYSIKRLIIYLCTITDTCFLSSISLIWLLALIVEFDEKKSTLNMLKKWVFLSNPPKQNGRDRSKTESGTHKNKKNSKSVSQIQSRTLHCCRSTVLEIWTHELIHFLSFATSLSAKPWCSRLAESGLSSVQFSQSVVAYSQFSVYYARSYAACLSVRPTNARSQRVRQPYVRLSDNRTMVIFVRKL